MSNVIELENVNDKDTLINKSVAAFENPNCNKKKQIDEKNEKSITRQEETDKSYEIKGESEENTEEACSYCNECKLTFPTDPQLKEHKSKDHLYCCDKIFSSMKSLNSHKWVHNTKSRIRDPEIHYPETEEQLTFFKSGRKEAMAYDKNFFSFM